MSQDRSRVTEQDLHAYIDGQLDLRRLSEVELYLRNNPSDFRMVHEYRQINQLLLRQQKQMLCRTVPESLKKINIKSRTSLNAFLINPARVAAVVAWLVVGITTGWILKSTDFQQQQYVKRQNFSQQAAFAHAVYTPEKLHPVEVDAKKEQHLFKWLSKRLSNDVKAPPLSRYGYELMGGRLLPNEGRPAAQFMYENKTGNRLTLYVRTHVTGQQETLFNFSNHDGIRVFYWIDGPVGYALSGTINKPDLLEIAVTVYNSLEQ